MEREKEGERGRDREGERGEGEGNTSLLKDIIFACLSWDGMIIHVDVKILFLWVCYQLSSCTATIASVFGIEWLSTVL